MSGRHTEGKTLVSKLTRCQELISARTGFDDFYELLKILYVKFKMESKDEGSIISLSKAKGLIEKNKNEVILFIEGDACINVPDDIFEECIRLLSSISVKGSSYDELHVAFEVMTSKVMKSDKGQYFTPFNVVDMCISFFDIKSDQLICDPACGSGGFLHAVFEKNKECKVYGFDISKRAVNAARFLSIVSSNNSIKIFHSDSLSREQSLSAGEDLYSIEQVMKSHDPYFDGFDLIVTNPPFAGDVTLSNYRDDYVLANLPGRTIERDVLFLERCHSLLKESGKIAIVLPDNKFSAKKFDGLREWMLSNFKINAVISLHPYTFRPFTSQKTCVLIAEKGETDDKVLFIASEKCGKNASGKFLFKDDGFVDDDFDSIKNCIFGGL
ncbi:TPA: methyltransferase domain-containing protein [Klebsiella pneumoniae]|nr:methyltransferase domain-containing protein [Klebsiella variicola]HBY0038490.1 methyltransferase domain-containing protein [Klebsiella pneumoniae]HBY0049546.1 methyltransferase domain-containing protein [Klebsiella pneumoniae]HBY0054877.1 methyltransferase domain-containing protein [Klebsiella pneumoniae]HBY0108564.1 methyltransferase domain-containing protein [Klebsiella pneumoniae]